MHPAAPLAVLFADISGSTRLYELAGDAAGAVVVSQCIDTLKLRTQTGGGRVMRIVGDEILAVFPSANAAAHAAMEMQSGVDLIAPAAGIKIGIRIGFHFGQVMERDGELYGDAVNVAARLATLAQKDQITTSLETIEALSSTLQASCRQLYTVQVKGREHPVELCEIIWRPSDDLTSLVRNDSAHSVRNATLRLTYRGKSLVLDTTRQSVSFGRDASADIVIDDAKASRAHCKIELRMDKFVLTDHSANGTYVTVLGDREAVLRREEFTLRGNGCISFGLPRADTAEWAEFVCEE